MVGKLTLGLAAGITLVLYHMLGGNIQAQWPKEGRYTTRLHLYLLLTLECTCVTVQTFVDDDVDEHDC